MTFNLTHLDYPLIPSAWSLGEALFFKSLPTWWVVYGLIGMELTGVVYFELVGGGSSPTLPDSPETPTPEDPDKWKRYLKWAAVAVVVATGAVVVYLVWSATGSPPEPPPVLLPVQPPPLVLPTHLSWLSFPHPSPPAAGVVHSVLPPVESSVVPSVESLLMERVPRRMAGLSERNIQTGDYLFQTERNIQRGDYLFQTRQEFIREAFVKEFARKGGSLTSDQKRDLVERTLSYLAKTVPIAERNGLVPELMIEREIKLLVAWKVNHPNEVLDPNFRKG